MSRVQKAEYLKAIYYSQHIDIENTLKQRIGTFKILKNLSWAQDIQQTPMNKNIETVP